MPPHQALETYDILHRVCEYMSLPVDPTTLGKWSMEREEDGLKLSTLARSARVCKLWSEPALEILWATLEDPAPLLSPFPYFKLYTTRPKLDLDGTTGHFHPADLLRFRQYARLVRVLRVDQDIYHGQNILEMLTPLVHLHDGEPLFPRLKVLHWGPEISLASILSLLSMVPRTLHCLHIGPIHRERIHDTSGTRDSTPSETVLPLLFSVVPDLCRLKLRLYQGLQLGVQEQPHLFQHLRVLKVDGLEPFTPEQMRLLSQLTNLEELSLKTRDIAEAPHADCFTFPLLKILRIHACKFGHVHWMANSIASRSLHTLELRRHNDDWGARSYVNYVSTALQPFCARFGDTLRTVSVQFPSILDGCDPTVLGCIRPLLKLRDLEVVNFSTYYKKTGYSCDNDVKPVRFDGTDFLAMAAAWPKLMALVVDNECWW
ncbi:hypothetical protein OBBRIDRAFT_795523 [Obba rivulosa]|uniref:F-box domain-containing protein n=1 Tax=Obba rivulosa TaxID=1052685 RepID=A0A8E2DMK2_9APHY|nr:hypothetical protein OBBRIDRAFT_795523 [Obba rivulosa]